MTDVHDTIDEYLARLDAALRELHEREREELLAEVRAHLTEAATRGKVHAAVRSLGDPRLLAERLREGEDEQPASERVKRILGMPYNFGPLSTEQITARIWNPSDPRIFMPRIFGIGWTVNFGAVAVRLRLVRPDDEEPVPFTSVPSGALTAGLAALTLVNLATVVAAVLVRAPRPMPVHWGFIEPNGFTSPLTAALSFLGPAVVLNALALWRFSREASPTERTLWVVFLAIALSILDGFYTNALGWSLTGRTLFFPGLPVLFGLALSFALLVVYSRLGVQAEWRRAHLR